MGGGVPRAVLMATYTIAQVLDQVVDLQPPGLNLGVEPFGKGLLLDGDPALLISKRHLGQEVLMRRLGGGEGGLGVRGLVLPAGAPLTSQGAGSEATVLVVTGTAGAAGGGGCGLGASSLAFGVEMFGVLAGASQGLLRGAGGGRILLQKGLFLLLRCRVVIVGIDAAHRGSARVVAGEGVGVVVRTRGDGGLRSFGWMAGLMTVGGAGPLPNRWRLHTAAGRLPRLLFTIAGGVARWYPPALGSGRRVDGHFSGWKCGREAGLILSTRTLKGINFLVRRPVQVANLSRWCWP